MITYGKKRKKMAKLVDFLSEESDFDASLPDSSHSSLPFALSPSKSPSKPTLSDSPNRRMNMQDLADSDPLTRSPRRYTRAINSMQDSSLAWSGSRLTGTRVSLHSLSPSSGKNHSGVRSRSASPTPVRRRNSGSSRGSKPVGLTLGASTEPSANPSRSPSPTPVRRNVRSTQDKSRKPYKVPKSVRSAPKLNPAGSIPYGPERKVDSLKPELIKSGLDSELTVWDGLFTTIADNKAKKPAKSTVKRTRAVKAATDWDDLFSGLTEKKVEKLDIMTKLNKDLHRLGDGGEYGDGGTDSDSDSSATDADFTKSYLIESSQSLEPQSRKEDRELAPVSSFSSIPTSATSKENVFNKATYGNMRSFLEGDGESCQDTYDRLEDSEIEPPSKDIHALKSLGKLQMEKEKLEFVLESLRFVAPPSSSGSVESCNQVLINCLVDLNMDIWKDQEVTINWKTKLEGVMEVLLSQIYLTWEQLETLFSGPNGKLIESLIVVLVYGIYTKADEENLVNTNGKVLSRRLSSMSTFSVSLSPEPYTLLSQTVQNINQIASIIHKAGILDHSRVVGLLGKEVCEKAEAPDFGFFKLITRFMSGNDVQLAQGLVCGCNNIPNIFELINDDDESFKKVKEIFNWVNCSLLENDWEMQLKVLELLVILSTRMDADSSDLADLIIDCQVRVVQTILLPSLSNLEKEFSGNLAVLSLGYLLNLVEFCIAQDLQIDFLLLLEKIFQKLPAHPSKEIEVHINGYFALVVAIAKVKIFSPDLIAQHLRRFRDKISNIGTTKIYEKIEFELRALENMIE